MPPGSWKVLAVALCLLHLQGSCRASHTPASCLAVVDYVAISGNPSKANLSSVFRGFVRVEDQVEDWTQRELSWTFTKGESIRWGDSVFREGIEDKELRIETGDVKFSSETIGDNQRVKIKYFADDEVVDIGFVASKGMSTGNKGGAESWALVGIPASLEYKGLECKESVDGLDHEFQSTEDVPEVTKGGNIVELSYLPVEFNHMRFDQGYGSNSAEMAFKLTNTGTKQINLEDVVVEYWFDGGTSWSKTTDTPFHAYCRISTVSNCSQFNMSVQPGLERVSGAHQKVVIGFQPGTGYLSPMNQPMLNLTNMEETAREKTSPSIEVIFNITSGQFFTHIDITKDYSFINTKIADQQDPDVGITIREYELNPKMPVFIDGELVFGSRPKASLRKTDHKIEFLQKYCWGRSQKQCGIRVRYCCDNPRVPQVEWWLPVAGIILACALASFGVGSLCIWRWYSRRPGGNRPESPVVSPNGSDESPVWRTLTRHHSIRSLSGFNALWDPRMEKSWTGHIPWYWESWDEAEARKASLAFLTQNDLGRSSFTVTTELMQKIDVHVDYKTGIEPFIKHQLGEGAFGKVYQATFKGLDVAVKVLKVETDRMIKDLEEEIKLSSKMHSDHVVKLLGASLGDKDNACLIMELVDGGNLSARIHDKNQRRLTYLEVLNIGLDIVCGLAYLHPTVVHRDLKPQNVLLTKEGRCKIADFGISKLKDPCKSYLSVTQTGGTPNYMAPELFGGTRIDEKCDIFSLGCILYEAMSGRVPLSDFNLYHVPPLFQIIKTVAIEKRRPKIPDAFPPDLAGLIRDCWKDNPRNRPSSHKVAERLAQMIDKEVSMFKELREAAQGKDSVASTSTSTDRENPIAGRRLSDPREETKGWLRTRSSFTTPEAKRTVATRQTEELETYHSAKSLDLFSGHREPEVPGNSHKLERAVSNGESMVDEVQEPDHVTSGPSSSIYFETSRLEGISSNERGI